MHSASSPSGAAAPRRTPSRWAVVPLLALLVALLSGCLRYAESLTISTDDKVSGIVVIAARTPGTGDAQPMPSPQPGQELPLPESSSPRIQVTAFESATETGYRVILDGASFDEVSQFAPLGDKGGALEIVREGDDVAIAMTIDLTYAVPAADIEFYKQQAKATVELTVPGTVVTTDGEVSGDTITWNLAPLELNTLHARITSPKADPEVAAASRSIDPVRAGIIGAVLLALASAGWLLARGRLRAILDRPGKRQDKPAKKRAPAAASADEPLTAREPAVGSRPNRQGSGPAGQERAGSVRPAPPSTTTRTSAQPEDRDRWRPPAAPSSERSSEPSWPPDPFGEEQPQSVPVEPSRVPSSTHQETHGTSANAGGGWPPPRPRWKEN